MATDALGRQLSEDGYYYWDGADWQPVDNAGASIGGGANASQQPQAAATHAQGRQLSADGHYYWDGSDWQPVNPPTSETGDSQQLAKIDWSEYPALARYFQFGSDVDGYLRAIGVDPAGLDDDNPAQPQ